MSTTQIYTQVSIRALQAVHAATHPEASNSRHRSVPAEFSKDPVDPLTTTPTRPTVVSWPATCLAPSTGSPVPLLMSKGCSLFLLKRSIKRTARTPDHPAPPWRLGANPVTAEAARYAEQAAEAVRAGNHATQPCAGGLNGPADVYDVMGCLAMLAARLPQALAQLQAFLDNETDAGRVRIVDGEHVGDPVAAVTTCAHWTDTATAAAQGLQHALDQAHAALTWAAQA